MAMVYAGADGETAAQLRDVMEYPADQKLLSQTVRATREGLTRERPRRGEGSLKLSIAASIWGEKGHPFREEYLKTIAEYHGGKLRETSFRAAPEAAVADINDWIAEETNGRIREIVTEDQITGATKLVLANAIYFKASWQRTFNPSTTTREDFHNADGSVTPVAMMYQQQRTSSYHETEDYQTIALRYDGGAAFMLIILPAKGQFHEVEQGLDSKKIGELLSWTPSQSRQVHLHMPRLEIEETYDLSKIMKRLGVKDAFSDSRADLSKIDGHSCAESPGGCLFVSKVAQKTFLKVDEAGTEAAAASSVLIETTSRSINPLEPAVMRIDRPYMMMVWSSTPLFFGRVTHMTPEMAGQFPEATSK